MHEQGFCRCTHLFLLVCINALNQLTTFAVNEFTLNTTVRANELGQTKEMTGQNFQLPEACEGKYDLSTLERCNVKAFVVARPD